MIQQPALSLIKTIMIGEFGEGVNLTIVELRLENFVLKKIGKKNMIFRVWLYGSKRD